MGKEPIIIVGGEPNSIFIEIFFKSLKTNTYKSPLIIIVSKKLLQAQMKKLSFTFKINVINKTYNFIKWYIDFKIDKFKKHKNYN